jgi:hypothetical protein
MKSRVGIINPTPKIRSRVINEKDIPVSPAGLLGHGKDPIYLLRCVFRPFLYIRVGI